MLVVSRDPAALRQLWEIGKADTWHLQTAQSGWEAMERAHSEAHLDLLLFDLACDAAGGMRTLRWLRRIRPELPIILLADSDDALQRQEAIRLGAQDYVVRPFNELFLETVIRRQLYPRHPGSDGRAHSESVEYIELIGDEGFLAASPVMRKFRARMELLAQVNMPVLIVGESGSGKEVAARLIHKFSARAGFRFSKINCAALPGDLLEKELFGYERSALSGDVRSSAGKLEACDQGTILLDEIEEMPTALQAKLVPVLQDKQFFRGEGAISVDVRVLATTSCNIERALAEGKLREDLYYRLSAFTVPVPPLRQRRDEIPLLLVHFMHQLARHYSLPPRTFSPAVMASCQSYSWPGNLRELENFVKRYLVIGDDELALEELERTPGLSTQDAHAGDSDAPMIIRSANGGADEASSGLRSLVQSVKGEAERNAITAALEETRWNRKAAARLLKVSYRTLLYKIQQYHMSPPATYLSSFLAGNGLKNNGHER